MSTPADMLLLLERQRKLTGGAEPAVDVQSIAPVIYYRAFSPVALFGTVARARVDHDRLQAALTCSDPERPQRGRFVAVTLEPEDLSALDAAGRAYPASADAIARIAHLAQRVSGDDAAALEASAALDAYRSASLRFLWHTIFANGLSPSLAAERDDTAAQVIAILKT